MIVKILRFIFIVEGLFYSDFVGFTNIGNDGLIAPLTGTPLLSTLGVPYLSVKASHSAFRTLSL